MWTFPHMTFVNPHGACREKLENNPKTYIQYPHLYLLGPYKLNNIILIILKVNNKYKVVSVNLGLKF